RGHQVAPGRHDGPLLARPDGHLPATPHFHDPVVRPPVPSAQGAGDRVGRAQGTARPGPPLPPPALPGIQRDRPVGPGRTRAGRLSLPFSPGRVAPTTEMGQSVTEYLQVALLAVIQGAAELLPVSSSAHVIFAQHLMGKDPASPESTFLLVMLHTG